MNNSFVNRGGPKNLRTIHKYNLHHKAWECCVGVTHLSPKRVMTVWFWLPCQKLQDYVNIIKTMIRSLQPQVQRICCSRKAAVNCF